MNNTDEIYMQRCLDLAANAKGNTSPNPMVGSVIVCDGKIIGEGYHKKCGLPHAEVNAVNSVKDKSLLKKSVLYVNLEPCAHVGRTPACSRMIIDMKIPEVVIGTTDNFEAVNGKGIEMLVNAGVNVRVGVLEKECLQLNRRFFLSNKLKRPFIILKWAQTVDGFIDFIRSPQTPVKPNWITDDFAKILVHKWRSEEDAIMIGTNTAEKDNPSLNVREWSGKNPVRIILDKDLRLKPDLNIFDQSSKTIVYNSKLNRTSGNNEFVLVNFSSDLLSNIFSDLYNREIRSVFVEGGSILLNSLISQNLWDEARVFTGEKFFFSGVKAPVISKIPENIITFEKNKLFVYKNF